MQYCSSFRENGWDLGGGAVSKGAGKKEFAIYNNSLFTLKSNIVI
jgi:hypothetical protein